MVAERHSDKAHVLVWKWKKTLYDEYKERETATLVGLEPDPHAGSDDVCSDLVRAKECLLDVWQSHRDVYSSEYNQCEKPGEECFWCDYAESGIRGIDKAIHILRDMK